MKTKREIIKIKINSISTSISSFLIPIFQYVPCTAIWRGIMSVPLITYLAYFFQNPGILLIDINFLFRTHGIYFTLFGFIFYLYSLVYQLTHRKQLIQKGPYKYIRHPQYIAFIIMTFGMTLITFQTDPITSFDPYYINGYTIIFYIWIGEVMVYVILGKIEEIALKAKYGDGFLEYANDVPFMFPFLKLKGIKIEKYGQYTIYFPITSSFKTINVFKNQLSKSKTTLEVLDTIKKNPGINSADISRVLNLSRNSIKYHVDKLIEKHLIKLERKGRKNELYSSYS